MKYLIALFFISCFFMAARFVPDAAVSGNVYADTSYKNPNGSSELSKLMRVMQQYTVQAKADVMKGLAPAPYPDEFDKVYTAKITEGVDKSDFYNAFADLYIMSVKNYATSTSGNRVETYNNMVSACLACHSQHCPGPVKAIKKLSLEPVK